MRLRLAAGLVALAFLWGVAFVGIKEVLHEVSPATLTILRFAVADVCLLALLATWKRARPRFERGDLWRLFVLAFTGVPAYHLALNWGEQRTSASVAALVVATAPVMVAVASALVLRERVTVRKALGITLAFGGVALLAFGRPQAGGGEPTQLVGFLIALLAPLAWAVYTIVAKPLTARADPLRVTTTSLLLGSLMLLPLVRPATFDEAAAMTGGSWAWVLLLGAGSSVGGYVLFVWALGQMEVTKVAVALYLVPVVGVSSAALLRDEPIGPVVIAAAALVIAGVALVQRDQAAPIPPAEEPVASPPARAP